MSDKPLRNHCTYRIKPGKEAEFLGYLEKHWPTLVKAGLATDEPATVLRCTTKDKSVVFVELFAWKTAQGPRIAHETPEVMQVWEPMGALCTDMEFNEYEPVKMAYASR